MIIPTIITSSYDDFLDKFNRLKGVSEWVQVDIVDGVFAPNKTVEPEVLADLDLEQKRDLHLMVNKPEGWVERCLKVMPDRIIGQVEKMEDPWRFINEVREGGVDVGLAFDLGTALNQVSIDCLQIVDIILLMGVKAGEGGQEFDKSVLKKIKESRELEFMGEVGVDGGLDKEKIISCKEAGADVFYVGSELWEAVDILKRYQELEIAAK